MFRQVRRTAVRLFGVVWPAVAARWFEKIFPTRRRHELADQIVVPAGEEASFNSLANGR